MLNKLYLFLALAAVVVVGCADEELQPAVTQDTLLFGAFPRLVELRTGEFDLADLQNSAYEMEVDFVDNAGGADVAQYKVYVAFDDNTVDSAGVDYSSPDYAEYRVYTPSDFTEGPNGNLGITVSIPFVDVANFAGVPLDSIESGDRFQVRTEVVKTDGRVFSSANSTPAITNAFGGIFNFNINATCPLPDDRFVGDYTIEYGYVYDQFTFFGQPVQALGTPPLNRTVTLELVSGSTTRRTFNIGAILAPGAYQGNGGTITLDFACNRVTSTGASVGLTCGAGNIGSHQAGEAPFVLNDDSTFTIEYEDFGSTDGGCGTPAMAYSLVFTKN